MLLKKITFATKDKKPTKMEIEANRTAFQSNQTQ